jgi:class 3 adenylate cyclase/tetratricopeptide (TPR) repeat protein
MNQPPTERRVVTALFVDVVGSTALGAQLGPERLKRLLERSFAELKACIDAEGGIVEKYIGDAIHALFGAPVAHVDDSHRALRAAHACVRWSETNGRSPSALRVRVGIETGEAIVDLAATEGGRQQMSIGSCVNLAARLQQAAEPGQVLVGPICHEATADVAEFQALGEIECKGIGAVPAWELVSMTSAPARGRMPFVGRESELDLLRVAYRRARRGRSVLALVSGPPGQGKTRLVDEFIAGVESTARTLKARCRPSGERGQRSLLHDLLVQATAVEGIAVEPEFGRAIDLSDVPLSRHLEHLFPDAIERHRVSSALSFSVGKASSSDLEALPTDQRFDEIANGWRRYFAELARQRPLIVWVEDLHWAEGEIVQLLDRLTLGAETSFFVIATARPEFGARAGLRPGGDRFFITLDPLDADTAESLARHAGATGTFGLERAGGNPLFIIELTRATARGTPDVPITLQGVIGARLDELPLPDRDLLQRASVVGETFTARDAALLAERDPAEVERLLVKLLDLQYLYPADGGYRFHHALVRDVAYGRLTTVDRMRLHARYAQEGVLRDDAEALAHHYWEAVGPSDAEWVWENATELTSLRERARDAHLAAARRCAARFAYERSIETGDRALQFSTGPADTARIEQTLGGLYAASGNADEAATHYLRARDLYTEMGVPASPDLYPDALEMPVYTAGMFVTPLSESLVSALLAEGKRIAGDANDAAALARLAALEAYRAHDPARLEAALRLSEAVTDSAHLTSLLAHAAILQNRLGDFRAAKRTYERLDAVPSGTANQLLEFRAILALNTGDVVEAERVAAHFVDVSRVRGPHLKTHAYREQSHVFLARGNWPGLRELAAQTEQLVAAHPATAFCYAVTTLQAFAVIADVLDGRPIATPSLLKRVEIPLQAEIFERESVLLLLYAVMGREDAVDALLQQVDQYAVPPFWFFTRTRAVALAMLQRWEDLDDVLAPLDRLAETGSPYLAALVAAIREEMAAARGGPAPTHQRLRELGYLGWSQLLAHRPSI